MYFGKFLLLVPLFIVQVTSKVEVEPHDTWDNARDYLDSFIATVQNAINEALAHIDGLDEDFQAAVDEAATTSVQAITDFQTYITSGVSNIRVETSHIDTGFVERCIIQAGWSLNSLAYITNTTISSCLSEVTIQIYEEISRVTDEVKNQINKAGQLSQDIDACKVADDGEECVANVAIGILLQTLEVPAEIEETVSRTEDVVGAYQDELPSCHSDRIQSAVEIADGYFAAIRTCVANG